MTSRELEKIIESNLARCSAAQQACFASHRVPFYEVSIRRHGKLETVYVVARFGEKVLYYEDVEEGFALTQLDETGAIAEQDCNQLELRHILQQLVAGRKKQT